MAGSAAVCPELRWVTDGADRVDSWSFNPHKWLFTTFDCTCLWFRDARPVVDALSITPAYLRNEQSEAGAVIDFRDWQVPLGRRFRALKPWLVMRHYGAAGLARHIRRSEEHPPGPSSGLPAAPPGATRGCTTGPSGSSPPSTAPASGSAPPGPWGTPPPSPPPTCATSRARRAPSSTSVTGRCRSAAASGRSSHGS